MPIYDYDGTTGHEIGWIGDWDGTANHQFSKIYDNDGTTNSLIYSAEEILYNNGTVVPYNYTVTSQNQYFYDRGSYLELAAYHWGSVVVGWYVDLTGYDTITVTGNGGSSVDGYHGIAVKTSKISDGYNLDATWSGSGTWTYNISSLSGYHYVSIADYAYDKSGAPSGYYTFKLTGLKLT